MSTVAGPLTYGDLCRAREDGKRYGLIDGVLLVIAGPSPKHQWASRVLNNAFERTVFEAGLGYVFPAPLDIRLGQDYVQPDILSILNERASNIGPTLIDGAPDLIVEVTSTSSQGRDRVRKRGLYACAGVLEYWLVELSPRVIVVHADPVGEDYALVRRETTLARFVLLPGFEFELSRLTPLVPDAGSTVSPV